MRRVAVLVAMEAEAMPLIARLGLSERPEGFGGPLPMRVFEGAAGLDVTVVTNGRDERFGVDLIATQPAALAAHAAIERLGPDLLISAGTAGGFAARGASIGDVYLSRDRVCYHDRRIPIPGFDAYGVGSYPSADTDEMARELGLKQGVVTTGNSLDLPDQDLAAMRTYGADVKDMEAASAAWVASLHEVPFIAVKSITDLVDGAHPTEDEFLANLSLASDRLTDAMTTLLEWIASQQDAPTENDT